MALPVANLVKVAVETIYSAFADNKTAVGARQGVEKLNELQSNLNSLYPVVNSTITADSDDAGVSEWITANDEVFVGAVLRMTVATFDLTDNALATAKGSAVAVGDIYVIDGSDSVEYLGNNDGFAFDFVGESREDFVSIGS